MLRIGILGRKNQGKSTLMNLLTGQNTSIVSPIGGTTTDPVKKTVELIDIGPVVFIDTAGLDDSETLGNLRIGKTEQVIEQIDLALLLISQNNWSAYEEKLLSKLKKLKLPFIVLHTHSDVYKAEKSFIEKLQREVFEEHFLEFSALDPQGIPKLLALIAQSIPQNEKQNLALDGLVSAKDLVLLITPIDSEAPKGRLILPQVQLIRQSLDKHCLCIVCQEEEVSKTLAVLKEKPKLVITDSQIFDSLSQHIPEDIPFTSFSVLLAKQKGNFEAYLKGTPHLDKLQNGDKILIMESCTHQSNCDDIGRVKIPKKIRQYTQKELQFDFVSGLNPLPEELQNYAMIIQCGACMITEKQLKNRLDKFIEAGIPISNYGMTIAYLCGIFKRATQMFCQS